MRMNLLLVDDSPEDRDYIKYLLQEHGSDQYHYTECDRVSTALQSCRDRHPDCVLLDYHLLDGDGLRFLDCVQSDFGEHAFPVVMLTSSGNLPVAVEALKRGALDFMAKDQLQAEVLSRTLQHAMEKHAWRRAESETRRRLQDSHERLQLTLTASGLGTCEWIFDSGRMQCDAHWELLFGLTPGSFEATYAAFLELVHPDDRVRVEREWKEAIQRGALRETEFRCVHPNGSINWISARGKIDLSPAGKPLRMLGLMQNITRRKQADTELRRQAQVLDQVHEAVIFADLKGMITHWNRGAEQLFGYTAGEVVGRSVEMLYFAEDRGDVPFKILAPVLSEGQHEVQIRNRRKDGSECWIHLCLSLLRDEAGAPYGMVGYSLDITARRKVQQALQASLLQLKVVDAAIRQAQDVVLITEAEPVDPPGPRILYVNEAFTRLTGYTAEEAIGNTPRMLQGPGTDRATLDEIRANLKAWRPTQVEVLNYRKDGTSFWSDLSIMAVADETGWYTHWVAVQRDITDKKNAEAILRDSELRYRLALQAGQLGTFDWDVTADRAVVDDNCRCLFGLSPEEEVNLPGILAHIHPDDLAGVQASMKAAMEPDSDGSYEQEYRILQPDGSVRWVLSHAKSFFDAGRPVRMLGVLKDITKRKDDESALRASEERLMLAQSGAGIGVWDWDLLTNRSTATEGYFTLYGMPNDSCEVSYEKWLDRLHPGDRDGVLASVEKAVQETHTQDTEFRIVWPNGEVRWLAGKGKVLCDEAGRPVRFTGINFDITDRKRAEEELQRSNEDLERFAYSASHDLQEPLRMVTIYSQLLAKRYKSRLDGDADELISTVLDGAKRMQNLIRSLLAYALSGQEQKCVATPAGPALEAALENLKASLKESGAILTYEDLPIVLAHPMQLAQVFQNLVGNALKYRQPGRPLEIQVTARQTDRNWVLSVHDNGIGFNPDDAKTVFEPFRRLQMATQPGTGLGLAICQRVVQRWGGAIWAESQPGVGSIFHIRLRDAEERGESVGAGG